MSYRESDIAFESASGGHFALIRSKAKGHRMNGFEVYRNESTHAKLCAAIGYTGNAGLNRVKAEIARRENTP